MARNPVMLTALAVLQHNDARLPEYRVELYDSIIGWLVVFSRQHVLGRTPVKETLEHLRHLALRMQSEKGGRLVQVNRATAASWLAPRFGGSADRSANFLEKEEQDSGVISSLGTDVRFWHLSFQEYLAARELAGLGEAEMRQQVMPNLFDVEWREVMLRLAGILCVQGPSKVDVLFGFILQGIADKPLPEQARTVALLGAMMQDLERMKYTAPAAYDQAARAVACIFDPEASAGLDITVRIEAADALARVGDARFHHPEKNWIFLSGVTFRMGATKQDDPEARENEAPPHQVTVSPFELGRYPVTVREYQAFIEASAHPPPDRWQRQLEHPTRPVVDVTWFDAEKYCQWLSVETSRIVRLPTEAEWERAARGQEGSRYPWGNAKLDASRANYAQNIGAPTPVGIYPAGRSPEGVDDLLGNVWEWCADWYGPSAEEQNNLWQTNGEYKTLRDGSWDYRPGVVRGSCRLRLEPSYHDDIIGFRCLREVP